MRHRPDPSSRHRVARAPRHRAARAPRHRPPRTHRAATAAARPAARLLVAGVLGTAVLTVSPVAADAPVGVPGAARVPSRPPLAEGRATPAAADARTDRSTVAPCAEGAGQRAGQGHEAPGLGRLTPVMVSWACDPFSAVAGLPATGLEREEPERLYSLVTREQAVEPGDYAPDDLVDLFGGPYQARQEVADQLTLLVDAARAAGHPQVSVTSGFRDHLTQAGTYEDWVRRAGAERAELISARPGHSEHQLGLAVDLTGSCGGFACFGESPEGRWVAEHAHRFGFIIRYPEGGADVTGYAYEPWHLRYVGPRAAWAMHVRGERYWETFAPTALENLTTGR